MVKENSDFLKQINLTQQNSATNIDNEGYVEIKLTQNTKQFSKKFSQLVEKTLSDKDINFKKGLDWRNITKKEIEKGAGSSYGSNLTPGNYIAPVKNQHVPTYSGTCWIWSTVDIYSNSYKIAEVASGNKNILDAELSRRNLSVQYICDYLGSPDANYKKNMDKERKKLKKKMEVNIEVDHLYYVVKYYKILVSVLEKIIILFCQSVGINHIVKQIGIKSNNMMVKVGKLKIII